MHENRTTYPKRKTQMYQQLQELPKKYKVLAIIKMKNIGLMPKLELKEIHQMHLIQLKLVHFQKILTG